MTSEQSRPPPHSEPSDPLGEALAASRESRRLTPQRFLSNFWGDLRAQSRVVIVALMAGLVVGIPTWMVGGIPSAGEVERTFRDYMQARPSSTRFTVLIADLANDDAAKTKTQQLFESFDGHRGLTVIRTPHTLRLPDLGTLEDGLETVRLEGEILLREKNADLLIWGTVSGGNLQLRFLPRNGQLTTRAAYSSGEQVTLPSNFSRDLGTQLEAVAFSVVAPASEQQGQYLVELLQPINTKLRYLLRDSLAFSPDVRASLWKSYALSSAVLGEQTGQSHYLLESVKAYRVVLPDSLPQRVPLDLAITLNNLGGALRTLGEREMGTVRLEEAVAAYRLALRIGTNTRVPLEWAAFQTNLGAALQVLGERETGTARLEEAVAAHRAALQVYTRERVPLDWAFAQDNLGTALSKLGQREHGTERLEEAVAAHRAALQVYTRVRAPLAQAGTLNSLGASLLILGERETGTERLEEAVASFRAALQGHTRERVPLDWAMTQTNLGSALTMLGERGLGTAQLEQAVAAYHAALQVATVDRNPIGWAAIQSNLGSSLQLLGERESSIARLEEAEAAYRAALQVYTREQMPLEWAITQDGLGTALQGLGQREHGTGRLQEAVAAYKAARQGFTAAGAEYYLQRTLRRQLRAERLLTSRQRRDVG